MYKTELIVFNNKRKLTKFKTMNLTIKYTELWGAWYKIDIRPTRRPYGKKDNSKTSQLDRVVRKKCGLKHPFPVYSDNTIVCVRR